MSNYKYTGTIGAAKPFDKGRISAHEGGHCFNLFHIWGDADCGDDNVSDTPTQQAETSGCPTFPHVSCSNSPNGDMFMNFMDYTDDVCLAMYTKGQVVRMLAVINNLPYSALKNSDGCVPPLNTGINILAVNNDLTIYPNPSKETVMISFTPLDKTTYSIEIQNVLGQILYKEEISNWNGTYSKSLDLQAFGKGIYTVHLRNNTGEIAKKIIVE